MPERRLFHRTDLKVFARGYATLGGGALFPFGAIVTNLSEGGAKLALNPDAAERFNQMALSKAQGASLDNAPVTFDIISYVQDNVGVTGRVVYAASTADGAIFGVEFGALEGDSRVDIRHVIESKPELEMIGGDVSEADRDFDSMDEFIAELTVYCINSGKEEKFRIAGELFSFVGMHVTPGGEPHLDLIESQDNPGKIFCPDCKGYIDPGSMI
ncbi:MAG: PilZ domain-containing protein [Nitrospinae bacterium]|nr:PilZ domain-containing protein [Nitrospinota bacterium]